ncbi:hypothetical protein [Flavobacterium panacagri]|uniref:hypothetical protein n=1 Tax=Flavobacterium panacagri TaxID=3034146 RepID=UPI0025A63E13|nr:hypothetical protein [Flavobacterium panacagri]
MKKFICILTAVVAISCNNLEKSKNAEANVVKKELRPFFDSDEIDHYYLGSASDFEHLSSDNQKQIEKKKEFSTFFYGYYPKNIEKDFEKLLLKYDYKKSNLSSKHQKKFKTYSVKKILFSRMDLLAFLNIVIFLFLKEKKNQLE